MFGLSLFSPALDCGHSRCFRRWLPQVRAPPLHPFVILSHSRGHSRRFASGELAQVSCSGTSLGGGLGLAERVSSRLLPRVPGECCAGAGRLRSVPGQDRFIPAHPVPGAVEPHCRGDSFLVHTAELLPQVCLPAHLLAQRLPELFRARLGESLEAGDSHQEPTGRVLSIADSRPCIKLLIAFAGRGSFHLVSTGPPRSPTVLLHLLSPGRGLRRLAPRPRTRSLAWAW